MLQGQGPRGKEGGHNGCHQWPSLRPTRPRGSLRQHGMGAWAHTPQRRTRGVPLRRPARPSCVEGGRPEEPQARCADYLPTFFPPGMTTAPPPWRGRHTSALPYHDKAHWSLNAQLYELDAALHLPHPPEEDLELGTVTTFPVGASKGPPAPTRPTCCTTGRG